MLGVRRARSPPENPFDFTHNPGPVWCDKQIGSKPGEIPFRIPQPHPDRPAEILCILSLDCGIHHPAYVETEFGQLYGIFVVDHISKSWKTCYNLVIEVCPRQGLITDYNGL